jgi:hypothetical protein
MRITIAATTDGPNAMDTVCIAVGSDELTAIEAVDMAMRALIASGYHRDNIIHGARDWAEERMECDKERHET